MLKPSLRSLVVGIFVAWSCVACAANSGTRPEEMPDSGGQAGMDGSTDAATDNKAEAPDAMPSEASDESTAQDAPAGDGAVGPARYIADVTAGHHKFSCKAVDYYVEVPAACA